MKKVTGFQTEDGALFTDLNQAHDHEIKESVFKILIEKEGMPKEQAEYTAKQFVKLKDLLLPILEKPKL